MDDAPNLIVPIITVYEIFKKFWRERGEQEAFDALSVMQSGRVIEVDIPLVLEASRHRLPLADSLIYATALRHDATLWTQDEHFKDLRGVRYFPKRLAV